MHVSNEWRQHVASGIKYEYRVIFADGNTVFVIAENAADAAMDAEIIRKASPHYLSIECQVERQVAGTILSVRMTRTSKGNGKYHCHTAE